MAPRPRDRARTRRLLGRGVSDGGRQHPNCPALQRLTGLHLWQALRVRRTAEYGPLVCRAGGGSDGHRRERRDDGPRQPLFRPATAQARRAHRPEAGHRPERTRPRTRSLPTPRQPPARATRPPCRRRSTPGYKATSVLRGESGLALAMDRDRLSDLRGVLTPSAAMGDALLARFPAAGVLLETSRLR